MSLNTKPPLRSGDLARQVGVSPDTLRLYERKGLLSPPPRSANGYRCYAPTAVDRVRLIQAGLSIGFTIAELAEILAMRDRGGTPCTQVRELAETKLASLNRHILELVELRDELHRILMDWDRALRSTARGKRAGLLEALASASPGRRQTLAPQFYSSLAMKSIHKEPHR